MAAEAASLVKNASDVFLATKLTFTNELAGIAEDLGVDVSVVLEGIGHDPRIGHSYMRPSYGFGAGLERGLPMHLAHAVSIANTDHQNRFVCRIAAALGRLSDKRIGILGLAFKAHTDDVRLSPGMYVVRQLIGAGADVRAHDPDAGPNATRVIPGLRLVSNSHDAFRDADAVVVATEWPQYLDIDWPVLKHRMRCPLVFDGRRLLDATKLRRAGYDVYALGDGASMIGRAVPEPDAVASNQQGA